MLIGARFRPKVIRLPIGVKHSSISNGYNMIKIPINRGTETIVFLRLATDLQIRHILRIYEHLQAYTTYIEQKDRLTVLMQHE